MQEFTIEIEIDEDANIKAETKNMRGTICADELDSVLKNLNGKISQNNKPEYYHKNNNKLNTTSIKTNKGQTVNA